MLLRTLLPVVGLIRAAVILAAPSIVSGDVIQHPFKRLDIPVPVTLGVMSRCPDALVCESVFDKVIKEVGHAKLNLSLTFVATPNATDLTYGATCLHGPEECLGNIHELCTIAHTPKEPTSSQWWWPFLQCINYEGRYKIGEEKLSRDCAKVAGIDWDESGIAECVAGEEGKRLLKESIERTRELGIKSSCTILINDKLRCIRDSTWKECNQGHEPADFIRTINKEYARLNPEADNSE